MARRAIVKNIALNPLLKILEEQKKNDAITDRIKAPSANPIASTLVIAAKMKRQYPNMASEVATQKYDLTVHNKRTLGPR